MIGGVGICKERALDGCKFESLREANESGVFSGAAMSNPSVGM